MLGSIVGVSSAKLTPDLYFSNLQMTYGKDIDL